MSRSAKKHLWITIIEKNKQKLDERFAVDEITLGKKEFVLDNSSCSYLHLETLQEQIRFENLI